jgi:hypothetical protein
VVAVGQVSNVMGNNLSVVGDIDNRRFNFNTNARVRYGGTQNSNFIFRTISQRIIVLDFVIRGTDR